MAIVMVKKHFCHIWVQKFEKTAQKLCKTFLRRLVKRRQEVECTRSLWTQRMGLTAVLKTITRVKLPKKEKSTTKCCARGLYHEGLVALNLSYNIFRSQLLTLISSKAMLKDSFLSKICINFQICFIWIGSQKLVFDGILIWVLMYLHDSKPNHRYGRIRWKSHA